MSERLIKPTHFTLAVSIDLDKWTVDQTFPTTKLAEMRPREHEAELVAAGDKGHWRYYAVIPSDGSQEAIAAGIERLNDGCTNCFSVVKELPIWDKPSLYSQDNFRSKYKAFLVEPWLLSIAACDAGRKKHTERRIRVEHGGELAFELERPFKAADLKKTVEIYAAGRRHGWFDGKKDTCEWMREARESHAAA